MKEITNATESTTTQPFIPVRVERKEPKDAYKSALEIILALCEKMDYKTSDVATIQTICETVLKGER